ncbi:F0F1 ATP synthase subunit A [Cytophagaceae bacterium ABcell3]|nr:F0F1 ATP synthase subunit A [Cytophagaceae bacterium ABcell3]
MFKKQLLIALLAVLCQFNYAFGGSQSEDTPIEEVNVGEVIMHHIGDAHEWHFATIGETHITLPLPVILFSNQRGLITFMSSQFHNEEHAHQGLHLDHETATITSTHPDEVIYDFSITKNVAALFIACIILVWVFLAVAKGYKNNAGHAPKGVQSFFEPIIVFIRDDVAKSIIGEKKYERFLPYLLTIFFFIWFNNLFGLFPAAANVTGNISVTFMLAATTFLITNFSGNKNYWGHVFNTPGVPWPIKLIIVPIEIISLFTKPFSLMVRLFANITAGHIIILSLLSLIFLFRTAWASLLSLPFALFMSFLELFVAILQAYIFTLLSAMYFSAAVEEHHEHEHDTVEKPLY